MIKLAQQKICFERGEGVEPLLGCEAPKPPTLQNFVFATLAHKENRHELNVLKMANGLLYAYRMLQKNEFAQEGVLYQQACK